MHRRQFLSVAAVTLGLAPLVAWLRAAVGRHSIRDEPRTIPGRENRGAWRSDLTPAEYHVLREHATERAGTSPLNHEKRSGHVRLRRVRPGALRLRYQVREWDRLAQLLAAAPQCRGHDGRSQLLHGSHRGALRAVWQPSGPPLRGWSEADWIALLHERPRTEVQARALTDADQHSTPSSCGPAWSSGSWKLEVGSRIDEIPSLDPDARPSSPPSVTCGCRGGFIGFGSDRAGSAALRRQPRHSDARPASAAREGWAGARHFCVRMLLVHRGRLRQGPRRGLHDVGVYRRHMCRIPTTRA